MAVTSEGCIPRRLATRRSGHSFDDPRNVARRAGFRCGVYGRADCVSRRFYRDGDSRKCRGGVQAFDAEDLAPRLLAGLKRNARPRDAKHLGEQLARRGVGSPSTGGALTRAPGAVPDAADAGPRSARSQPDIDENAAGDGEIGDPALSFIKPVAYFPESSRSRRRSPHAAMNAPTPRPRVRRCRGWSSLGKRPGRATVGTPVARPSGRRRAPSRCQAGARSRAAAGLHAAGGERLITVDIGRPAAREAGDGIHEPLRTSTVSRRH
jgi:hypothetical protein